MIRIYRDVNADTLERIAQATRVGIREGLSPILERLFNGLQGSLKEKKFKEAILFAKQISAQKDSPKRVKTLVTALKNRIKKFAVNFYKAELEIKEESEKIYEEIRRLFDELRSGALAPYDVLLKLNDIKKQTEKEKQLKKYAGKEYFFRAREFYIDDHIHIAEELDKELEAKEKERKERAREQKMQSLTESEKHAYTQLETYIEWCNEKERELNSKTKEFINDVKAGKKPNVMELMMKYNEIVTIENRYVNDINDALRSDKRELKKIGHRATLYRKSVGQALSKLRKAVKSA